MKKKWKNPDRDLISGRRKIFRVMKLTFLFLSLAFFSVSANSFSQAGMVTIQMKDAPLSKVFDEIESQTNYALFYKKDILDDQRKVSVDVVNTEVSIVLHDLLKSEKDLGYKVLDNSIVIAPNSLLTTEKRTVAQQQAVRNITGVVKDATGEPLPGVAVLVKGSTNGVVTDLDGKFTINAVSDDDILVFSFIGMTTQEVAVGSQQTLDIVLKDDAVGLGEVVVAALGIRRETKALTYNVQEIKPADVFKVSDASFANNLAGKIAGVSINSSSSGIGGATKVVMRGNKSISGNNNAMYVVDGIPLSDPSANQPNDLFTGMGQSGDAASQINPEDIASMSILSGAAAAALYGASAANGVILITTKKGEADVFSINVSNSTLFYNPFVMPKFQNTYGSENGSFLSWGNKLTTPSNYDPKDFFQTGFSTVNSVNLSTGNKNNQTFVSVASLNAEGIVPNNDLSRYNFSVRNSSSFLDDKLNLDLSMMYMSMKEQNMLAQGQYFNPLVPVYLFPRGEDISKYQTYERYNVERNFKTQYWPYGSMGLGMQNPYWIINRDMFVNHKDRLMLSGALKYDISDWLFLTGRAKVDKTTSKNEKEYSASTDGIFAGPKGAYYLDNYSTRQIYSDVMLNANKYIGDFSVTAILGASVTDVVYDYTTFGGDLKSVPNSFTLNNLNTAVAKRLQDGYHDQNVALFATAQVGYKGMVYFDVTCRNDYLTALAHNHANSVFYPSFGLSGILTEMFPIKSDLLSYLKIRGSYSEVGNAPKRFTGYNRYEYLSTGTPASETVLPTELEPERTKSWEAGLNCYFFNDRLKLDVTLYKSSTYDQLFNPQLSAGSGNQSVYINGGRVDNKGIELTLGYKQEIASVNWNTSLVYSLNRNKIKQLLPSFKISDGQEVSISEMNMGGTGSYRMILTEGGSMGDVYVNTLKTDEHGYIIVDQNSQSVSVDPNTFIYAGNVNPKYTLGWRNNFDWKGINLGFLVNARVGGVGVSVTQALMDAYGVSEVSAKARDNGGVRVNGQLIPAQSYYQTVGGGTSGVGSMYTYKMTNVRLAEVTLGYNIPIQKYVKAIKGMNVSLIGRNLLMIYNKAPFDPELTASTGTYYQGIDYFMMPSLRSLGFSCKIQF